MFRNQRTRCISLGLLLGLLLPPLPAAAGGWDAAPGTVAQGWEHLWEDLLGWLGLLPAVEADSSSIDPNGQPHSTAPGSADSESSSSIDPNGKPSASTPSSAVAESSSYIDPDGRP
jgi:hypothetical protein